MTVGALVRGERRSRGRSSASPAPAPQPVDQSTRFELPADIETLHIATPDEALRVYQRHPEGSVPLIFLHELGGAAEQWAAQLAAVGPKIRAIAYDMRGHGGSRGDLEGSQSDPEGIQADDRARYSLDAGILDLARVVDGLDLDPPVLVGHGFGASIAAEYAAGHPQQVAGILLVDPAGDQSRVPAAQRSALLDQLRRDPGEETAWQFRQLLTAARTGVAERILHHLAEASSEALLEGFESAVAYNPVPTLRRYPGPTRCLVSDLNTLPYSLPRLMPELPSQAIPGTSHWLMMDQPDTLWEILVDFLEEIYPTPSTLSDGTAAPPFP
ncbi:MAG: alpha/beta hydrolase [Acidobacteriota bacterium]